MNKYIGIFGATLVLTALSTVVNAVEPCIFCGDIREEVCRNCHDDLDGLPMLKMKNHSRHHVLAGTPIPSLERSKAPDAPGGIPGEPYDCFSCHALVVGGEEGALQPFTDCLQCHPIWQVTGLPMNGDNVHHETETFQQQECGVCHSRTGGIAAD